MKKLLVVSSLSLIAATPALAEEAAGDQIVVTASRSGEGVKASQLGASVTVLDADAVDKRQTRVVSDILRDVPGVAVSHAIGGLTQIRLRGSEANHALVLIDGIEASDPYNGEFDFDGFIADQDVKIEVLRGQQSSLYGSDAIGGVVHYITLSGAEAPGFIARAEGGSFDSYNGTARFAGVAGALDYVVSGGYYRTDGTPTARNGVRDIGAEYYGANAKVAWSPTENFKLTAVARYSRNRDDSNSTEQDSRSPLFGYIVDTPGGYSTKEAFYGLVRAEVTALEGRWTNALTGQFVDVTRKGFLSTGLDNGSNGRRYKGSFESSLRFGSDTIVHRLTAAVDVEREEFQNQSPFGFPGRRNTDNLGVVGQYELVANDALTLGASIRRDENNRFADTTTWRVQGSYKLLSGTRIRAAYGTGVKNPGYFELYGFLDGKYIGNPNLKPEKSEGWEVGVEQTFVNVTVGATYFDSRLKDEIFTTFPAPTFVATPTNRITQSKQHGVEAFVAIVPSPQIRFDFAYTYLKARENGTVEVRRPRHIGSANLSVASSDQRFTGTLTLRYNGVQQDVAFTDPSFVPVNVRLKDYTLVNLNAAYSVMPNLEVFGRIENLANEHYEEVFSYRTPGRTAYAGLRVKL